MTCGRAIFFYPGYLLFARFSVFLPFGATEEERMWVGAGYLTFYTMPVAAVVGVLVTLRLALQAGDAKRNEKKGTKQIPWRPPAPT